MVSNVVGHPLHVGWGCKSVITKLSLVNHLSNKSSSNDLPREVPYL
jgi:hypothetical protein